MIIFGIDQSYTSTGVVVTNNKKIIYHTLIHTNQNQDMFDRANVLADNICELYTEYQPQLINIEGLAFGIRGNATRNLAGLQYVIICNIRKMQGNTNIITPKSLKKFATGSGKANKQDMYNALPNDVENYLINTGIKKTKGLYDLVDAYWLSVYEDKK